MTRNWTYDVSNTGTASRRSCHFSNKFQVNGSFSRWWTERRERTNHVSRTSAFPSTAQVQALYNDSKMMHYFERVALTKDML